MADLGASFPVPPSPPPFTNAQPVDDSSLGAVPLYAQVPRRGTSSNATAVEATVTSASGSETRLQMLDDGLACGGKNCRSFWMFFFYKKALNFQLRTLRKGTGSTHNTFSTRGATDSTTQGQIFLNFHSAFLIAFSYFFLNFCLESR